MTIVRIALPVATWSLFDYWAPDGIGVTRGSVLRAPLAKRSLFGVALALAESSEVPAERLQPVLERIDLPPLPEDLLDLAAFVSRYYQQPLGLVLGLMLPGGAQVALRREQPPTSWRPTERGRAVLRERLPRLAAPAQALVRSWLQPQGERQPENGAPPSPAQRRSIARWFAQGLVEPDLRPPTPGEPASGPALNPDQQRAASAIAEARGFTPILLQGVTGSGKTEVYLAASATALERGEQVLFLVPEINLTPQLEQRVRRALRGREVVTLHSALAAGERRRAYLAAAEGRADVVIGTRLAVFTPLPRLGLVVIDEEHDPSFKQQDNVRYHARDVAVWRARQRDAPIVLGSATPALETLTHARAGRYRLLLLPERAAQPARMPTVVFESARAADVRGGLGAMLVDAIAARLARAEQSLVFINRRGYAPSLLCHACGWRAECSACSARLVVHRDAAALRCHHCGRSERLPRACPDCGNVDLLPVGYGTQRLEQALRDAFPDARIARIDRDTTRRKGAFSAVRADVHAGAVDILVGTQILAKGHDFPRLTLVGVLGADNALYSADFRATERLGAILFQVAGRAGRAERPGEVIVQTDYPTHALYRALVAHDYDRLADTLLAERRAAGMPPFSHLVLLAAEGPSRSAVEAFLDEAAAIGRDHARGIGAEVEVFAPVPAGLARRAGMERAQVVVQSTDRSALQRFLPGWRVAIDALRAGGVRWAIDVDPASVS